MIDFPSSFVAMPARDSPAGAAKITGFNPNDVVRSILHPSRMKPILDNPNATSAAAVTLRPDSPEWEGGLKL